MCFLYGDPVTESELLFQKLLDPLSSMLVVGVCVLSFQSEVVCVCFEFSVRSSVCVF